MSSVRTKIRETVNQSATLRKWAKIVIYLRGTSKFRKKTAGSQLVKHALDPERPRLGVALVLNPLEKPAMEWAGSGDAAKFHNLAGSKHFHGSAKDVDANVESLVTQGWEVWQLKIERDVRALLYIHSLHRYFKAIRKFDIVIYDIPGSPLLQIVALRLLGAKRLTFRSHNAEALHRIDYARAMNNKRERLSTYALVIRRFVTDWLVAKLCIAILVIDHGDLVRYWYRLAGRKKPLYFPYLMSQRARDVGSRDIAQNVVAEETVFLHLGSFSPGLLIEDSERRFHELISKLPEMPGFTFARAGRRIDLGEQTDFGDSRVIDYGFVKNPLGILDMSKALVLPSSLGRGFKTKIYDAIECGCWVILPSKLLSRMDAVFAPYCVSFEEDNPESFRNACEVVSRRPRVDASLRDYLVWRRMAALDSLVGTSERTASQCSFLTVVTDKHEATFAETVGSMAKSLHEKSMETTNVKMTWIVVVNAVDDPRQEVSKISEIVQRVHGSELFEFKIIRGHPPIVYPTGPMTGSVSHAAGLHNGLAHVADTTGRLVVIDPDFMVFCPDWMGKFEATASETPVRGVTWNPANTKDFIDFPSPHFMWLDLMQVDLAKVNFSVDEERVQKVERKADKFLTAAKRLQSVGRAFKSLSRFFVPLALVLDLISRWLLFAYHRKITDQSGETGHLIRLQYPDFRCPPDITLLLWKSVGKSRTWPYSNMMRKIGFKRLLSLRLRRRFSYVGKFTQIESVEWLPGNVDLFQYENGLFGAHLRSYTKLQPSTQVGLVRDIERWLAHPVSFARIPNV